MRIGKTFPEDETQTSNLDLFLCLTAELLLAHQWSASPEARVATYSIQEINWNVCFGKQTFKSVSVEVDYLERILGRSKLYKN